MFTAENNAKLTILIKAYKLLAKHLNESMKTTQQQWNAYHPHIILLQCIDVLKTYLILYILINNPAVIIIEVIFNSISCHYTHRSNGFIYIY